jgi:hypothetical protein
MVGRIDFVGDFQTCEIGGLVGLLLIGGQHVDGPVQLAQQTPRIATPHARRSLHQRLLAHFAQPVDPLVDRAFVVVEEILDLGLADRQSDPWRIVVDIIDLR